jgi:glucosamine-6-phosphate deaminase
MNVLLFDSPASWCAALATYWRDRLRLNPALRHCLPSGNTPIPLFREMAQLTQRGVISFRDATVFVLDEFGGLAPDDPGTCRNMLERDFMAGLDLPRAQFRYFNAAAPDLDAECRAYDGEIGNGFDLVLLGIGGNGHLGMNEPGSGPDAPTRRTELHPATTAASARYLNHGRLPTWGLTVGMKQFFASKEVWLIATGRGKANIVKKIVKGECTEQVPASLMRQHSNCSLFIDAEAGSLL